MDLVTHYGIPAFISLLILEVVLTARRGIDTYEPRDASASLAMGVGNLIVAAAMKVVTVPMFFFLYEHRIFELGTGWVAFVLLFFAEDFTYYWFHRGSHEVRFLWAAHVNHHSSQRYNLATALRQSWTTPFTTLLFYWTLPLLGFHPVMIAAAVSMSLLYQFWIHTELIDRLPAAFEYVFNTPSHHRVHHGSNVEYLDRNHGGILIIWDRLFGTFEPEAAPVRYGLTKNISTFNPFRIAFHEWAALWNDMRQTSSWSTRLIYALAPPGWRPDGSSTTSRKLRAAMVAQRA